jgi:hypothetical protein
MSQTSKHNSFQPRERKPPLQRHPRDKFISSDAQANPKNQTQKYYQSLRKETPSRIHNKQEKKQLNPTLPLFWFLNLWFLCNNKNNNNNNNHSNNYNNNNNNHSNNYNNNNNTHIGPISLGSDRVARPNFLGPGTPANPNNLVLEPLSSTKLLGSERVC